MDADTADVRLAAIASAIADPARARMLCCLLDGRARTATELAALADVGASTASSHFQRLREQGLVTLTAQGRHRYYSLAGGEAAAALEALLAASGTRPAMLRSSTPPALRAARTCYDHMAGELAVRMHDALFARGWLHERDGQYDTTCDGEAALAGLGLDIVALRKQRRRFACPCLDWSERKPHVAGALGAALLQLACSKGWLERDMDSRVLRANPRQASRMARALGMQ